MFECFRNQNYPKSQIEWIIVDDGTDKIEDLVKTSGIEQIKYFALDQKLTLGAKRNFMHEKTRGSIIVYMDDDDYYPPDRISHAVETLLRNPRALCAGSSEIYVYFKHVQKMMQFGPYGPNHATAGTFAFRRELLAQTKYDESATFAEEKVFLKNYTVPFVQLDPMKTILVFSHNHNTFDKRRLLESPNPQFTKETNKSVDAFIRLDAEQGIKRFFMEEIDGLLKNYEPGEPKMKPDVMKQIKEVDEQRRIARDQQMPQITIEKPGEAPRLMTSSEIVETIQSQKKINGLLIERMKIMEQTIQDLRQQLSELTK
jgi:glycosyltransferase involved in cell wall biosynthesis